LSKSFGALKAVTEVDLAVEAGTVHSIIGPNGAGKTTLFNLLAGVLTPSSGTITFNGNEITRLPVHRRCRSGIGRSYQVTSIFPELTVHENVRLAVQSKSDANFSLFRRATAMTELMQRTDEILAELGLSSLKDQTAGTIPYGSQRSLDVAIALAVSPLLLLLDEPTSGMSPEDTRKMIRRVKELAKTYTIVLIEHDMNVVMTISDVVTVLSQGSVIAEGSVDYIRGSEAVKKAYLGGGRF
jgi:branched-chain amino acid transport system ATP-binding protein